MDSGQPWVIPLSILMRSEVKSSNLSQVDLLVSRFLVS